MFDQQVSKGKERYRVDRNSVIYLFSSSDNKDRFVSEPEKYTLAYGGYCAYGVRMGQKLQIDPNSFVVQGGSGSASLW
jgi:YHS domain-containing protein